MRKNLLFIALAAISFAACSEEHSPTPVITGNSLRITKVETNATEEAKAEVDLMGAQGIRLLEYNTASKELLQQSTWKKTGEQWSPEGTVEAVDGGHIVALYPAGDKQAGLERIFKAGENNMISIQDIDRAKTNEAALNFTHEMCQIELKVKDKAGKEIKPGNGKGQIKSATLSQPAEMTYDAYEGTKQSIGTMQDMAFDMSVNNYVIPGGKDYILKAVYLNSKGEEVNYTYKPEQEFVKNKKYVITLTMDTEDENAQLEVSVSVEEWEVEEFEAELVKNKETENNFMEFVDIPAGSFMMGSPKDMKGAWANEKPQHKVNISAFKMGKYQVTFDQYDEYCEETGAEKMKDRGWGRGNRPVIFVNWTEANEFCKWLSKKLGGTVRLPTEAEWEYACRAGSTTKFFWGNSENGFEDYCWCSTNVGWGGPTQPVGQKKPNAFGLYDMCGNVQEWCSDWATFNYNWSPKESTNPTGPKEPIKDDGEEYYQKIYRGGCYYTSSGLLYSSKRSSNHPEPATRQSTVGFRVVMEI